MTLARGWPSASLHIIPSSLDHAKRKRRRRAAVYVRTLPNSGDFAACLPGAQTKKRSMPPMCDPCYPVQVPCFDAEELHGLEGKVVITPLNLSRGPSYSPLLHRRNGLQRCW